MSKRIILAVVLGSGVLGFAPGALAGDSLYTLILDDASGVVGSSASVATQLDAPQGEPLSGWAWGVCHDGPVTVAGISDGATTATVNGGGPPEFSGAVIFPGGWTVGVVINFMGEAFLPPGSGYELHLTEYELDDDGLVILDFCDTLGDPPILTVVVDQGGVSITPAQVSGSIEIQPLPADDFVRGDCNVDGDINIADGIFILVELFQQGPSGPCAAACNVNGDDEYRQEDAMFLLSHLFLMGPQPPAPYPGCGAANAGEECAAFPGC